MAGEKRKPKWAVSPTDNVQHFYLPIGDYFVPCCDKDGTVEAEIKTDADKPKCQECVWLEPKC